MFQIKFKKPLVFFTIWLVLVSPSFWLDQFVIYFSPSSGFSIWSHISFFAVFAILTGFNLLYLLSHIAQKLRTIHIVGINLVILTAMLLTFHAKPIGLTQMVGAPALLQFLISFCVVVAMLLSRMGKAVSVFVAFAVITRLIWGEIDHPFNVVEAQPDQSWVNEDHSYSTNCQFPTAKCAFQEWLRNRPDLAAYAERDLPYPVFLISAEGGGIYAAAHTFATLEHASLACPNFRQHIFSISAVSGGAMGAARFVSDHRFEQDVETIHDCQNIDAQDSAKVLDLSEDYFSTVLGGFIFGNIVQFLVPFDMGVPSSGEFLEASFLAQDSGRQLSNAVLEYWQPEENTPAVVFNTTNVETGRTELISPFPLDRHVFAGQGNITDRIQYRWFKYPVSIVTGASLAARFPFITPTGKVPEPYSASGERYADGGYYENTGAAASLAIDRDIRVQERLEWGVEECGLDPAIRCGNYIAVSYGCAFDVPAGVLQHPANIDLQDGGAVCASGLWKEGIIPVSFIHVPIIADYSSAEEADEPGRQGFFDPLTTLLATRVSRGRDAIIELSVEECGYSGKICHGNEPFTGTVLEFEVSANSLGLPLGWSLGVRDYVQVLEAVADNFNANLPMPDCDNPAEDDLGCRYPFTAKQLALTYALTGKEPY